MGEPPPPPDAHPQGPAGAPCPFDLDTAFGRDLAAVDWAATSVGPWQHWPASLVNTVRLVTGSRFAMWMAWGPDRTFFCNDAYRRDTLGAKYPWALGRPAREVWSEIWPDIGPRIASVLDDGASTWDEGLQLFLERSGYVEETYHTFSYSPIAGDDGAVAGMLCVVSEETDPRHRRAADGVAARPRRRARRGGHPHRGGGGRAAAARHRPVRPALRRRLPVRRRQRRSAPALGQRRRRRRAGGAGRRPPPGHRRPLARGPVRRRAHPARRPHRGAGGADRGVAATAGAVPRGAAAPGRRRAPARSGDRRAEPLPPPGPGPVRLRGPGRQPAHRRDRARPRVRAGARARSSSWPSWTAPRPRSSPTSATSCAPR